MGGSGGNWNNHPQGHATTTYRNLGPQPYPGGGYGPGPTGGTFMNATHSPSYARSGYGNSWDQGYNGPSTFNRPPQNGPSHINGMEVVSVEYRDGGVLPPDSLPHGPPGPMPPPRY